MKKSASTSTGAVRLVTTSTTGTDYTTGRRSPSWFDYYVIKVNKYEACNSVGSAFKGGRLCAWLDTVKKTKKKKKIALVSVLL